MKNVRKIIAMLLTLCVVSGSVVNVFAESSTKDTDAAKPAKITIIKEILTEDKSSGVITKVIDFTYEQATDNKANSNVTQPMAAASILAYGTLSVSLTPDYYTHSVEIDWTLSSSVVLGGVGFTTCLMDGDPSLTQIDLCVGDGLLKVIRGQFNYSFGKSGTHYCDVLCSYLDLFGEIFPNTGLIPFSV